jgi:F0F1-type ATP synthase assembly protein I
MMNDKNKQEQDDSAEETRKSGMAYAAAFALFTTVAIFLGIGWLIDRWLDKSPLFLVIGIILGAAVGIYEFYRLAMKISE